MAKDTIEIDKGFNKTLKSLKDFFSTDGIFIGIQSEQGQEKEDGDALNLAEIGAVHEFGSLDGTIPQRSFLRKTFDDGANELTKSIVNAALKMSDGSMSVDKALNQLGLKGVLMVKGAIRKGIAPALAQETIDRKGSTKQLIDTGRMINSIRHKVKG